jgi:DNA-binding GntR family transcriptional regulator
MGKSAVDQTRYQWAYEEIRRRILDGDLASAAPLSEYQLADLLQLSRTPVREALKRLEHEGLVRSIPNRGASVAESSVQDIMEIYQVREQLEGLAARIAAETMPDADVEKLEDELRRAAILAAKKHVKETFESDVHLHKRIIESTRNGRLVSILATLDDQVRRIRAMSPRTPGRLEATLREHREIVGRIRDRDASGAEAAMRRHLRAACENAIRLVLPASPPAAFRSSGGTAVTGRAVTR